MDDGPCQEEDGQGAHDVAGDEGGGGVPAGLERTEGCAGEGGA